MWRAVLAWTLLVPALACEGPEPRSSPPAREDPVVKARRDMVRSQLAGRDIRDPHVLRAMATVPRERFVPPPNQHLAYRDHPLPIGLGQTISQPYIVALTTQLLRPGPGLRVLDVGTGSGYQAAVLAEIVDHVYGIEILCPLADRARRTLTELGYRNVTVRCGNGYGGWPEHAPFDIIAVAAAPRTIPQALVAQLAPGGRMVVPVGEGEQSLTLVEKDAGGKVTIRDVAPVRFVPMTGEP